MAARSIMREKPCAGTAHRAPRRSGRMTPGEALHKLLQSLSGPPEMTLLRSMAPLDSRTPTPSRSIQGGPLVLFSLLRLSELAAVCSDSPRAAADHGGFPTLALISTLHFT